ncbi:MAG: flavin reductase family protein [bacterium]|nr:flavin reductase family protein [bacterium]
MQKLLKKPSINYFYPSSIVMVSCIDKEGRPNIITIGAVGIMCAKPPIVGIAVAPERYSYSLIEEQKEYVVNIPSSDLVKKVDYCGTHSGRDKDKFKETGLTPQKAEVIKTPLIKECPVNLECKVKDIIHLGSHSWFIGKIVAVHVNPEILDERGNIDKDLASPFVGFQGGFWKLDKLK